MLTDEMSRSNDELPPLLATAQLRLTHADLLSAQRLLAEAEAAEVEAAHNAWRAGVSQREIGLIIGVSKQSVSQMLKKHREASILKMLAGETDSVEIIDIEED